MTQKAPQQAVRGPRAARYLGRTFSRCWLRSAPFALGRMEESIERGPQMQTGLGLCESTWAILHTLEHSRKENGEIVRIQLSNQLPAGGLHVLHMQAEWQNFKLALSMD